MSIFTFFRPVCLIRKLASMLSIIGVASFMLDVVAFEVLVAPHAALVRSACSHTLLDQQLEST
jgi:hypothetical protein